MRRGEYYLHNNDRKILENTDDAYLLKLPQQGPYAVSVDAVILILCPIWRRTAGLNMGPSRTPVQCKLAYINFWHIDEYDERVKN